VVEICAKTTFEALISKKAIINASAKDLFWQNKRKMEICIKRGPFFWLNNLNQSDSFLLFDL
jgi:hypothetical protein